PAVQRLLRGCFELRPRLRGERGALSDCYFVCFFTNHLNFLSVFMRMAKHASRLASDVKARAGGPIRVHSISLVSTREGPNWRPGPILAGSSPLTASPRWLDLFRCILT